LRKGSYLGLKSLLLIAVLMVALPLHSFAAVDPKVELEEYMKQVSALDKYEIAALSPLDKYDSVNASNRKAVYISLTNSVIPNYTKFVTGMKAIKPGTKELATIHTYIVTGVSYHLQALILSQKALSTTKINAKTFSDGDKLLEKSIAQIAKWHTEFDKYSAKVRTYIAPADYIHTLPSDVDVAKAVAGLKPQIVSIAKAYAKAVDGDPSNLKTVVNAMIVADDELVNGPEDTLNLLQDKAESLFDSKFVENNQSTAKKTWANKMALLTVDEIGILSPPTKSNSEISINFVAKPEGSSKLNITLLFVKLGDDYVLNAITTY